MIDCEAYPEYSISLKNVRNPKDRGIIDAIEWTSWVMDTMNELRYIFKPLAADMLLYCYYKDSGIEDWDIRPIKPSWYLREIDIPKNIYAAPAFKKAIISGVTEINKKSVVAWVENALKQESPNSQKNEVNIDMLNFRTMKAKIIDKKRFQKSNKFVVEHFRLGVFEYPLKKINGEIWVYSPLFENFDD